MYFGVMDMMDIRFDIFERASDMRQASKMLLIPEWRFLHRFLTLRIECQKELLQKIAIEV